MTNELSGGVGRVPASGAALIRAIARAVRKPRPGPGGHLLLGGLLALGQSATAFELSDLDGSNGLVVSGIRAEVVSAAGDVNDDGVADFLIGAREAYPGASQAYVVFGRGDAFPAELDPSTLDGSNGFVMDVIEAGYTLSFSGAGDVNGDGVDDLVIGAPFAARVDYGTYAGRAYVVFGHAGGFPARVDPAGVNGANGFAIGGAHDEDVGKIVAGAGDVNRDGHSDLLIAASHGSDRLDYVVFGHTGSFQPLLDPSTLDGSNGFAISGSFNRSSGARDVNGDDIDDIIIGARGYYFEAGRAFVVFGASGGFPDEVSVGYGLDDHDDGFLLLGPQNTQYSYYAERATAAAAGDVNGDGIDDMLVLVKNHRVGVPAEQREARCYLVFGTPDPASPVQLADLDGTSGGRYFAFGAYGLHSIGAAGDINGDGFGDFLIGSPLQPPAGVTYVLFGHDGGLPPRVNLLSLGAAYGFALNGVEGVQSESGSAVAGIGDVNSDGFDDILIGAPGQSYVVFGSPDFVRAEPPPTIPPTQPPPPPPPPPPPITSSGGGAADITLLALAWLHLRRRTNARQRPARQRQRSSTT